MNKICKVCGDFKWHRSWKTSTCEACIDAGLKYCPKCDTVYPIDSFYSNHNGTISGFCIVCERGRSRDSKRHAYSIDENAKEKERIRCHKRRAAIQADTYTVAEWLNTVNLFDNACAYCGAKRNLTMDHVIPIKSGGRNILSNIVPACKSCNSRKNSSDIIEWYTAQVYYSIARLERIQQFIKGGEM